MIKSSLWGGVGVITPFWLTAGLRGEDSNPCRCSCPSSEQKHWERTQGLELGSPKHISCILESGFTFGSEMFQVEFLLGVGNSQRPLMYVAIWGAGGDTDISKNTWWNGLFFPVISDKSCLPEDVTVMLNFSWTSGARFLFSWITNIWLPSNWVMHL